MPENPFKPTDDQFEIINTIAIISVIRSMSQEAIGGNIFFEDYIKNTLTSREQKIWEYFSRHCKEISACIAESTAKDLKNGPSLND